MKNLMGLIVLLMGVLVVNSSQAQTVVTSSRKLSYDITGDSLIDKNDTMIIIRHLFGFSGTSLVDGLTLSADSLRSSPEAIASYLASLSAVGAFDVDGNGRADALSDGILISRFYGGARRAKLIDGVVDPVGLRTTDQDIIRYIRKWDF